MSRVDELLHARCFSASDGAQEFAAAFESIDPANLGEMRKCISAVGNMAPKDIGAKVLQGNDSIVAKIARWMVTAATERRREDTELAVQGLKTLDVPAATLARLGVHESAALVLSTLAASGAPLADGAKKVLQGLADGKPSPSSSLKRSAPDTADPLEGVKLSLRERRMLRNKEIRMEDILASRGRMQRAAATNGASSQNGMTNGAAASGDAPPKPGRTKKRVRWRDEVTRGASLEDVREIESIKKGGARDFSSAAAVERKAESKEVSKRESAVPPIRRALDRWSRPAALAAATEQVRSDTPEAEREHKRVGSAPREARVPLAAIPPPELLSRANGGGPPEGETPPDVSVIHLSVAPPMAPVVPAGPTDAPLPMMSFSADPHRRPHAHAHAAPGPARSRSPPLRAPGGAPWHGAAGVGGAAVGGALPRALPPLPRPLLEAPPPCPRGMEHQHHDFVRWYDAAVRRLLDVHEQAVRGDPAGAVASLAPMVQPPCEGLREVAEAATRAGRNPPPGLESVAEEFSRRTRVCAQKLLQTVTGFSRAVQAMAAAAAHAPSPRGPPNGHGNGHPVAAMPPHNAPPPGPVGAPGPRGPRVNERGVVLPPNVNAFLDDHFDHGVPDERDGYVRPGFFLSHDRPRDVRNYRVCSYFNNPDRPQHKCKTGLSCPYLHPIERQPLSPPTQARLRRAEEKFNRTGRQASALVQSGITPRSARHLEGRQPSRERR